MYIPDILPKDEHNVAALIGDGLQVVSSGFVFSGVKFWPVNL